MSNYNLKENYIIIFILILIIIALVVHTNMNSNCDNFDNIDANGNIENGNIIQNYNYLPKKIKDSTNIKKAYTCNNNEIQIGEYCKDYKTDVYRKMCLPDETYSDGFCIKGCPNNELKTGNPHICLTRCPDGYLDDGFNCIQIKNIFN
jgi:hypothetical protein